MTKLANVTTLALLALIASTSLALASVAPPPPGPLGPPGPAPHDHETPSFPSNTDHSTTDLECRVKGLDFWIINFGSANIDSGRQVEWKSPTTRDGAVVVLPRMLAPGQQLKLAEVLSDTPVRGAPCTVAFV